MLSRRDQLRMACDELGDIAAFASTLNEASLATPSLCANWRVDDVLAHLVWNATAPPSTVVGILAMSRMRPDARMSAAFSDAAIEYRSSHTIGGIIQALEQLSLGRRAFGPLQGMWAVGRPREFLVDSVVHHFDMRRPLGQPRRPPDERLLGALQLAPTIAGLMGSKQRSRDLRLVATDVEWSDGRGPLVQGSAEALLLALTGRTPALDDLVGDGVPVLAARVGR